MVYVAATAEFQYQYTLSDHLGNVRLTFTDENEDGLIDTDPTIGEILHEDQFYFFGLRLGGLSLSSGVANRYRYNGKELHDELGLNWYDYGFRWYDPAVGRFVSVDPLAEKFYHLTTYQYASNDPIANIDLDGLEGVNTQTGEIEQTNPNQDTSTGTDELADIHEGLEEINGEEAANKNATLSPLKAFGLLGFFMTIGISDNSKGAQLSNEELQKRDEEIAKKRDEDNTLTIKIDFDRSPEAATHLDDAIKSGKSNMGVLDRAGSAARRRGNLKGIPTQKGKDRDEAPPAVINTGQRASVKYINPSDNRRAGRQILTQITGHPDGTKVRIIPINIPRKRN